MIRDVITNTENYPFKPQCREKFDESRTTRSTSNKVPMELGFSNSTRSTLRNDAIRCWKKAPKSIKNCKSLNTVKEQIKSFVKTLPI